MGANVKETKVKPKLEDSGNAEDLDQKQTIRRRPYTFHIGAPKSGFRPQFPHPSDTPLGSWRDLMLTSTRNFADSRGKMRNQSGISIGVADGVGSWAEDGVDPSLFPQALMYYAHQSSCTAWAGEPEIEPSVDLEEHEEMEGQEMTPYECLDLAYTDVLQEKPVEAGSSTACIVSLNASSGVLRSANLGDSGYLVVRSNSIFYESRPQDHEFNCPKQLAEPKEVAIADPPSIADIHEMQLCDGDIVIVFTDGLSDNVFVSQMVTGLRSCFARAGETASTKDGRSHS